MTSLLLQSIMASPTTLNIGEPADERSVDGNTVPLRDFSPEQGDQEPLFGDIKGEGSEVSDEGFSAAKAAMGAGMMDYEDDDDIDCEKKKKGFLSIFPDFLITPTDVCYKIVPAVGAVSYGYFSLSVMDPEWFSRAFGDIYRLVGNSLWFQAHLGAGLYIYSHRHIKSLPATRGMFYSIFGSVLFNFGSCMVWGLGKSLFPTAPLVKIAFGMISSCLLLYAGQDYLQYVDDNCSELD